VFSNISERKEAEEQMKRLAHHDTLTDLPNRILFNDRLHQAINTAKREKGRLALMFIDLDKFKPVNDTYGHAVGDLLLQEVASRLLGCVRDSDTVSRIGGDEFVILLSTIESESDATLVAGKILNSLVQPFELTGIRLSISSSIGISIFPDHGSDEKRLTKHADIAMYHAKHGGRNNAKVYQTGMKETQ
jgi:diguanylate cyclase (GGDEF)-like protein